MLKSVNGLGCQTAFGRIGKSRDEDMALRDEINNHHFGDRFVFCKTNTKEPINSKTNALARYDMLEVLRDDYEKPMILPYGTNEGEMIGPQDTWADSSTNAENESWNAQ